MNKRVIISGIILLFFISFRAFSQETDTKLVDYVNPFIGTGALDAQSLMGNTFPGATMPFGLVQLSPYNSSIPGKPGLRYDYNHNIIHGFSHTNLSGTGVTDLLDISLMPAAGDADSSNNNTFNFHSFYSHDKETASPGYYQVYLLDYNINAEFTVTEHAGFHKYTFPENSKSHILVDMEHSASKKRSFYPVNIVAHLEVINDHVIEGYRIITGWGVGYRKVYFRAEFSKPFIGITMIDAKGKHENLMVVNGGNVKALLNFETAANEVIKVKVGLSTTSNENARMNLEIEIPDWDFDKIKRIASDKWNEELSTIIVEGTQSQKEIFYTGMYHAFIQPNNLADINGDYMATDMVVRNAYDKKHYSTFSLWDTYRAAHPLYTLVQTKRTANFINSMIRQFDTYGYLPVWQLWGLENDCMIGNHAIPVVVDASLKGINGFDIEKAYEAVKGSALTDHFTDVKYHGSSPVSLLNKYEYLPEDIVHQSVSLTLEMTYDNWCVAQLAKKLGRTNDYNDFMKRAEFHKNLFDSKTGFFRAKDKDGNWMEPFNPLEYSGNDNGPYTEANAWQYLFHIQQDVKGLIKLMGGNNSFCAKLDTLFTLNDKNSKKNQNASGFIGQYAHGNEPSHHVSYLYNFAGQPWKTQELVARIQNEFYSNSFSGYAGNEDCGQMSAWYIFSAMGFYPVNPANGVYVIGSPILKSAEIHLDNGKIFKVITKNTKKENVYIQSAKLNGKPYTKTYITQNDIILGGILEFVMGNKPNKNWGVKPEDAPPAWGYK